MDRSAGQALVKRILPTESDTERETLTQMLDFLRATVVNKAADLTDEQATTRSVASSELTVASLVKHLSGTERFWFNIDFASLNVPWPWTDDDPHGNFPIIPGDTLASLVSEYEAECGRSRAAIAGAALTCCVPCPSPASRERAGAHDGDAPANPDTKENRSPNS